MNWMCNDTLLYIHTNKHTHTQAHGNIYMKVNTQTTWELYSEF